MSRRSTRSSANTNTNNNSNNITTHNTSNNNNSNNNISTSNNTKRSHQTSNINMAHNDSDTSNSKRIRTTQQAVIHDPHFFLGSVSPFLDDNEAVQYCSTNHYNNRFLSQYKLKHEWRHSKAVKHPHISPMITNYIIDENTPIRTLPPTVELILVGEEFKHDFHCLSSLKSLHTLIFDHFANFNRSLDMCLPDSLEHLIFRNHSKFNQKIDKLPPSLKSIQFLGDARFDQLLTQLPLSIEKIILKGLYKQSLPDSISGLEHLSYLCLDGSFDHELPKLPDSIRKLILGSDFTRSFSVLPAKLGYLKVDSQNPSTQLLDSLALIPVTELNLSELDAGEYQFSSFNPHIKRLTLPNDYNNPLPQLPPTIEYLRLGHSFDQEISHECPQTLKTLILGEGFNRPIPPLPPTLDSLTLDMANWDYSLDEYPPALKRLTLGDWCTKSLDNLPSKLEVIHFGNAFNGNIDSLPESVREIKFGFNSDFNHPIQRLPRSLEKLSLAWGFAQPIQHAIPPSLRELEVGRSHKINAIKVQFPHILATKRRR